MADPVLRSGVPVVAGRVLLVIPADPLRAVVDAVLRSAGHQVHMVEDAVAFAQGFADGGYVLGVVALSPGFADGARLLHALRARFPGLPLVLFGDPATPGAPRLALEVGALDLLPPDLGGVAALGPLIGRVQPVVSEDHTLELQRLRAEVQAMRLQTDGAASAERQDLERYAAEVAHDLNGPLRTIRHLIERLDDRLARVEDPEGQALAQRIHAAVDALQQLVDGALEDVQGTQDRDLSFTSNADRVFDEVVQLLDASIQQSSALVTRGQLAEVAMPPHQLRQILQNLVGNALRYGGTPPEVHVTARWEDRRWVLSVRDNGAGIPPDRRADIFRPLTRLDSGGLSTGREVGHGLGLSICKRLVERVGGDITVEDAPGGGSVFRVSLPADLALEDEPTAEGG